MKGRNHIKLLALVLCVCMLGGIMAACNSGTPDPSTDPSTAPSNTPAPSGGDATLVLRGGVIQTMDADRSTVTAVAVKDDVIVYVGDDAGVEEFIGDATEIIELDGQMVLPGFVDSHIHPASGWVTDMYECNLAPLDPTEESYVAAIKDFADRNSNIPLIKGAGFQVNAFDDLGPTKEALDAVVSDRPVIISDTSKHAYWVNSKAIEMAGIDENTPDPEGGKIYRNADGSIRGYFADAFLFDEVLELGTTTIEQFEAAWTNWQAEANSYGITSFSGGGDGSLAKWEMVDNLLKDGKLTLRANMPYRPEPKEVTDADVAEILAAMEEGQKFASDYNTVRTVKLFIDGVVEGRTGLLLEPYDAAAGTEPDYKGYPIWTKESLEKIITAVDGAGYAMHMHTIADGSVRMGVDIIEQAMQENGSSDSRHVLTHITIMDPTDIPRMAENGIIAAMQPTWFYRDPWFSALEEQMLGTERFNRMYVIKDMVDAGITMTGSADYSVLPDYRPLIGIEAGTTQCSPYPGEDNDPAYIRNTDQAVSLMTMLEAYTINGAFQMGMESKIGSLEVGKLADMVILEKDLFAIELQEISGVAILRTILGGVTVFKL